MDNISRELQSEMFANEPFISLQCPETRWSGFLSNFMGEAYFVKAFYCKQSPTVNFLTNLNWPLLI